MPRGKRGWITFAGECVLTALVVLGIYSGAIEALGEKLERLPAPVVVKAENHAACDAYVDGTMTGEELLQFLAETEPRTERLERMGDGP